MQQPGKRSAAEIAAEVASAVAGVPSSHFEDVLGGLRRHWASLTRRRFPALVDDFEDAAQSAIEKLLTPGVVAALRDPACFEAWARNIFVNALLDLARGRRRARCWGSSPGERDADDVLRDRLPDSRPTPEDAVASAERLRIVKGHFERFAIARHRFLDGWSEKEIASQLNISRDAVAGKLKRLRKELRRALQEED